MPLPKEMGAFAASSRLDACLADAAWRSRDSGVSVRTGVTPEQLTPQFSRRRDPSFADRGKDRPTVSPTRLFP
jgi:hypothetical protein